MIKAVSFDLDGTLFDSTEAILKTFKHTFDVINEEMPTPEVITPTIGHTLDDVFRVLTKHDTEECVQIYREHYPKIACQKTFLMPRVKESLERCRKAGLKIGFATSKHLVYSELILEHFDVLDYFEVRIGPDEVVNEKPHPEPLLRTLELFGIRHDEMFFVGDTRFDVLAAKGANVRCLAVATGYATAQELALLEPEAIFDSLTKLTDYIMKNLE